MALFESIFIALLAFNIQAIPTFNEQRQHTPLITQQNERSTTYQVSLGPRPYYIIQNMTESPLKDKLESCENGPFSITSFSIGHRGGGTLQFPEETVESIEAGARMGAGILECDVAFTKDLGLVCRHSLCDLHTTTDILSRPELASKCSQPFQPANMKSNTPASVLCCTSDLTTREFQSLCGKMDGFNPNATTPETYQGPSPTWRTELYDTCGTVLTVPDYIDLVNALPGYRNFTPELKTPPSQIPMPFTSGNGTPYTQEQYARDMIETFIEHGIDATRVWPQSFLQSDVMLWLKEYPEFGDHAILLDESGDEDLESAVSRLQSYKDAGINIVAPPIRYLLAYADGNNDTIVPSSYANTSRDLGLELFTWTLERSGPLATVKQRDEYYFGTVADAITHDGQIYEVLELLISESIGVKAVFSDWSSTLTYFANCLGLDGPEA